MAVSRFLRASAERATLVTDYETDARFKARRAIKRQTDLRRYRQQVEQELRDRRVREEARQTYVANQLQLGRAPCAICERFYPLSEIDAHIHDCQEYPPGS